MPETVAGIGGSADLFGFAGSAPDLVAPVLEGGRIAAGVLAPLRRNRRLGADASGAGVTFLRGKGAGARSFADDLPPEARALQKAVARGSTDRLAASSGGRSAA